MSVLKILVYSLVFASLCSSLVVWLLERRQKKRGAGGVTMTDAFPPAALTFALSYLSALFALAR